MFDDLLHKKLGLNTQFRTKMLVIRGIYTAPKAVIYLNQRTIKKHQKTISAIGVRGVRVHPHSHSHEHAHG